ncbi:nitric oxide synthase oxygenase [Novosphingobium sp. YJ-S2-02]|uniref:Nitric oxide synthase oxygenase n=1 Tax=Novosphingobium aureum TaxID=2792964 RepID=A0A931HDK0_9SPHN|nr:nitric oxide synthase oxygenase [Novosphingobium aureum]MBH0113837.1 nitric oxide synthase oxygenase [Novosphingobium aureum]
MYIDSRSNSDPLRRRLRRLTRQERIEEAVAFVRQYHRENDLDPALSRQREREVSTSLRRTGHYEHTREELAFGARVAWRNHARCIGRLFWKSLEVFDCRDITSPDAIAGQVVEHLRFAGGNGQVRSAISVFAPVVGDAIPAYIENRQAAQYAGHLRQGGGILGDPLNAEFTRIVTSMGWRPPEAPGRFDLLPLLIRDPAGHRHVYDLPADSVREVDIRHPANPGFAELALRWYTVPLVSDMILTIGGIDYPCAPFNGFYMGTEIASRNFVDHNRYDLLDEVGRVLGLDQRDALWKDTALTELNRAVLHSFDAAGATIVDHHTASRQFLDFAQKEQACGRVVSANWSWIVPPQASAACQTFHLPMRDHQDVPNYYRSRALDAQHMQISYSTIQMSRWRWRWRRALRRTRAYLRRRF